MVSVVIINKCIEVLWTEWLSHNFLGSSDCMIIWNRASDMYAGYLCNMIFFRFPCGTIMTTIFLYFCANSFLCVILCSVAGGMLIYFDEMTFIQDHVFICSNYNDKSFILNIGTKFIQIYQFICKTGTSGPYNVVEMHDICSMS